MIVYSPLDGDPIRGAIKSKPRHCFLMTQLGNTIPPEAKIIRDTISKLCSSKKYKIIDASTEVTSHDFLFKIWKLLAASPLSIGVYHEEFSPQTQMNIFYELGAAQAMGKETVIVKSNNARIPSDLIRTEYLQFDKEFEKKFLKTKVSQVNTFIFRKN